MDAYREFADLAEVDKMPLAPTDFVRWVNEVRSAVPILLKNIEECHRSMDIMDAYCDELQRELHEAKEALKEAKARERQAEARGVLTVNGAIDQTTPADSWNGGPSPTVVRAEAGGSADVTHDPSVGR